MEFVYEYGLFLLKSITVIVTVMILVGIAFSASSRQKTPSDGAIQVHKINDDFDEMKKTIKSVVYDKELLKQEEKDQAKSEKKLKKEAKKQKNKKADNEVGDAETAEKRVFLLDFDGDMKASAVEQLRQIVSAILLIATPKDEVVVRLESPGGLVHSYGLAASQLKRIREREVPLTVCVDKVAASGGYMMACVANKICSAPFAIIGSIGVVAQLPNFHRLLKKNDIDFELLTAGEYKRTLTMLGENTDKAREKFVEDLELTHELFKDYVSTLRPDLNIEEVATGEIWFGSKAKEKHLVDSITTSDDYITSLTQHYSVYEVSYSHKKTFAEKLGFNIRLGIEAGFNRVMENLTLKRFF